MNLVNKAFNGLNSFSNWVIKPGGTLHGLFEPMKTQMIDPTYASVSGLLNIFTSYVKPLPQAQAVRWPIEGFPVCPYDLKTHRDYELEKIGERQFHVIAAGDKPVQSYGTSWFGKNNPIILTKSGLKEADKDAYSFFFKREIARIDSTQALVVPVVSAASYVALTILLPPTTAILTAAIIYGLVSLVANRVFADLYENQAENAALANSTKEERQAALRYIKVLEEAHKKKEAIHRFRGVMQELEAISPELLARKKAVRRFKAFKKRRLRGVHSELLAKLESRGKQASPKKDVTYADVVQDLLKFKERGNKATEQKKLAAQRFKAVLKELQAKAAAEAAKREQASHIGALPVVESQPGKIRSRLDFNLEEFSPYASLYKKLSMYDNPQVDAAPTEVTEETPPETNEAATETAKPSKKWAGKKWTIQERDWAQEERIESTMRKSCEFSCAEHENRVCPSEKELEASGDLEARNAFEKRALIFRNISSMDGWSKISQMANLASHFVSMSLTFKGIAAVTAAGSPSFSTFVSPWIGKKVDDWTFASRLNEADKQLTAEERNAIHKWLAQDKDNKYSRIEFPVLTV